MSRRPAPVSYAASLAIDPPEVQKPAPRPLSQSEGAYATDISGAGGQGRVRRPLEERADPSVLYLHPAGKKALRLYAVERGVKVHDLLLEAVEEWATAKGLQGPWRVPSAGPPRRRRM